MKATRFEFRFRLVIGILLYVVGFWAPWERYTVPATHTAWLALSTALYRWHALPLETATTVVTVAAIVFAFAGAGLRIWGTAYLGASTVSSASMKAGAVMASGPYRYVRNPLYLGSWLTAIAVSMLMPATGAIFLIVAQAIFCLRLILAEEAFLAIEVGAGYLEYKAQAPRLIPALRARIAASPAEPKWARGLLNELYPLGVALCLAVLAWRYDVELLVRCVLVCFGLSLVVRALVPREESR